MAARTTAQVVLEPASQAFADALRAGAPLAIEHVLRGALGTA